VDAVAAAVAAEAVPVPVLLRQQAVVVAGAVAQLQRRVRLQQQLGRLQQRLLPFPRFRELTGLLQQAVVVALVAHVVAVDEAVVLRQRPVLRRAALAVVEQLLLARRSN